jgi:hypothetical protein
MPPPPPYLLVFILSVWKEQYIPALLAGGRGGGKCGTKSYDNKKPGVIHFHFPWFSYAAYRSYILQHTRARI